MLSVTAFLHLNASQPSYKLRFSAASAQDITQPAQILSLSSNTTVLTSLVTVPETSRSVSPTRQRAGVDPQSGKLLEIHTSVHILHTVSGPNAGAPRSKAPERTTKTRKNTMATSEAWMCR
ncbi:hypothetical protein HBI56_236370 [Parastagonospora nodorum]|uniref:Uncharacterized protein n=1 Tax=Phaeosphaeria nodorum (strain SN15 / ATCC MYA-4574 / FGSC 10173) TaxID=321614 RepID=A0A7U2HXL8_PHANO|nr:hypothetical protein HBH56_244150 [Parastagonospora nodorum]QRC95640.1 hypothetical protein JI435_407720 [Parastagonospora nodorum SN15]KAH3936786.1 hypothetical protein HBH54_011410 [Parastagonospora nodorum]KAH3967503.1 hypothetical protein HBH51_134870 [Parastagonospora nodorum]KAH4137256.1 hypothetical protein HBH45_129360 [Parastagonospora nodorum]